MNCLNNKRLAALMLDRADDDEAAHIAGCTTCASRLTGMRRISTQLANVHARFSKQHETKRAQLLAMLSGETESLAPIDFRRRPASPASNLTRMQRAVAAGITSIVAAALLLALLLSWASPSSAMDRVVQQLQLVQSYSYRLFTRDTFLQNGETQPTTIIHTGTFHWLAPDSFRYDEKLVRTSGPKLPNEAGDGLLADFTGIHPAAGRGIFIYHAGRDDTAKPRTYYYIPSVGSGEVGDKSPITRLRNVRAGAGTVLENLGTKKINGKEAAGYTFALHEAEPDSGFDKLEVWIDPETHRPIELGYVVKSGDTVREFRISDCKWNVDFPPSLFDPSPPVGYTETDPPNEP